MIEMGGYDKKNHKLAILNGRESNVNRALDGSTYPG